MLLDVHEGRQSGDCSCEGVGSCTACVKGARPPSPALVGRRLPTVSRWRVRSVSDIRAWLDAVVDRDDFRVEEIDMAQSAEWAMRDGALAHRSGRFFRVVGTRWAGVERPLIEQTEVGTLGFVRRRSAAGIEFLAYAKIEPGNVGVAQIAPSFQATASNVDRVHGGASPPGQEWFGADPQGIVFATLESEQGSRFLGKLNRNMMIEASGPADDTPLHRWLSSRQLLAALADDFTVNTDARSVICCSPWDELVEHPPFTQGRSDFAAALAQSYASRVRPEIAGKVDAALEVARARTAATEVVALDAMSSWRIGRSGITPIAAKPYRIKQIRVHSISREVTDWDQPIVDSAGVGRVDLVCSRRGGVLRFGFRPLAEPGLLRRVELGPSCQIAPGEPLSGHDWSADGAIRISCRQSDEGGRFDHDVTVYRVIEIAGPGGEQDWIWLSLSELQPLLARGGMFTSEARSALSLLLSLL